MVLAADVLRLAREGHAPLGGGLASLVGVLLLEVEVLLAAARRSVRLVELLPGGAGWLASQKPTGKHWGGQARLLEASADSEVNLPTLPMPLVVTLSPLQSDRVSEKAAAALHDVAAAALGCAAAASPSTYGKDALVALSGGLHRCCAAANAFICSCSSPLLQQTVRVTEAFLFSCPTAEDMEEAPRSNAVRVLAQAFFCMHNVRVAPSGMVLDEHPRREELLSMQNAVAIYRLHRLACTGDSLPSSLLDWATAAAVPLPDQSPAWAYVEAIVAGRAEFDRLRFPAGADLPLLEEPVLSADALSTTLATGTQAALIAAVFREKSEKSETEVRLWARARGRTHHRAIILALPINARGPLPVMRWAARLCSICMRG